MGRMHAKGRTTRIVAGCVAVAAATVHGATYYVSSSAGDDSRTAQQAQSPSTPWASLDKVNALELQPGDSVLLKTGDTFRGGLDVGSSGAQGDPIVYGSYGSLAKPVIDGTRAVSGWSGGGGGVYRASVTHAAHQLFVDRTPMTLARHPNEGYFDVDAVGDVRLRFTDADLGGVDWSGARVHVRTKPWSLDARAVSAYSVADREITLDRDANYDIDVGNAYCVNNPAAALDSAGEWYHDSADGTLRFMPLSGGAPADGRVTVTVDAVGVAVDGQSYVVVRDLVVFGHYDYGIRVSGGSHHCTVRNCDALCVNGVGIDVSGGEGMLVRGCSSVGANYYGMRFQAGNSVCTENVIRRVGMIDRLGKDGLGGGCCKARGLQLGGEANECSYNRLDSIGYNGIGFGGIDQRIERNVVKHFCLTTYDGSAIYTWSSDYAKPGAAGTVIRENIIVGGIGPEGGVVRGGWWANGIYLDDRTHDITVERNTVANAYHGIYLHNTKRHVIRDNTVFNCSDYSLLLKEDSKGSPGEMVDNVLVGNEVFALNARYQCLRVAGSFNYFDFGRLDSNAYVNPYNPHTVQRSYKPGYPGNTATATDVFTLAQWRSVSGDDLHSVGNTEQWQPYTITDTLGVSLIANGTFDQSVDGWSCWPCPPGGVSWDTRAALDSGCAAVTLDDVDSVDYALAISPRFELVAGTSYLLSFSVVAPEAMTAKAIARFGHSPYTVVGLSASFIVDTLRRDYAYLFDATHSDPDCRIDFDHKRGDSLFWLDNVTLYEVQAGPGDGRERARLFYNDARQDSSVSLEGAVWEDLWGDEHRGALQLQPFTSAILLRAGDDTTAAVRTKTGSRRPRPALRYRGGGAMKVSLVVHERSTVRLILLDLRGRVVGKRTYAGVPAGRHLLSLPSRSRGAATGAYILRLAVGADSFEIPIVGCRTQGGE